MAPMCGAVSSFSDTVGRRLLGETTGLAAHAVIGVAAVLAVRITSDPTILGWANGASGGRVMNVLRARLTPTTLAFIVLLCQSGTGYLPLRDFGVFVERMRDVTDHG